MGRRSLGVIVMLITMRRNDEQPWFPPTAQQLFEVGHRMAVVFHISSKEVPLQPGTTLGSYRVTAKIAVRGSVSHPVSPAT